MKIRSPVIASGGGSIAGLTLSHNRGGLYMRARATPTNPSSAQQVLVRSSFGNLSTAWQGLTQVQRDAWTVYAINVPVTNSLGESITLTGHQMYVRCNTPRLQAGLATVDDGPTVFSQDTLAPIVVIVSEALSTFSVAFDDSDPWVDEDDAALLAYVSRQFSPSINYFKGPYRLAGSIDGNLALPPSSPDTSLTLPFAMTEGNKFSMRFRTTRADGRISPVQFVGPQLIAS